jgi:hypothetical protein
VVFVVSVVEDESLSTQVREGPTTCFRNCLCDDVGDLRVELLGDPYMFSVATGAVRFNAHFVIVEKQ